MRVFRNKLFNIRTTAYDFFVVVCLLYNLKPLAARMLFGHGINAARKRNN